MALSPGARLGSYEILGAIGAGGMGEVYRARDPRLGRDVAIKILSAELSADPAALARFEREATSVAKLSHPNVLSIFELASDNGTAFVVTELVDGETLRARLEAGPLAARRAVNYGLQIARGMGAAHARGIVHRDLKPENVMITRDDLVKILDFGLAKSVQSVEADVTIGPDLKTGAGMVLGTFGYMAPEQARGQNVDHRADIFAFGALTYEMLSGQRAFSGETAADTMTAVLTKDPPDLDVARLAIAPGLERIVRRCLEKTPDLRFQSANDLAFALETLSTVSTSSAAAVSDVGPARRREIAWLPWAVAALALLTSAVSIGLGRSKGAPDARWNHFTRVSEMAGEETAPSLSPDGSVVIYSARGNGGRDIYSQRVGGRNATPIVNDPARDEAGPAFSPDGSLIAFHESDATGGIFVAGATGESVRRLTNVGFDPSWSADGTRIAFTTEEIVDPVSRQLESTLHVVGIDGSPPRRVIEGDAAQAAWSPSGGRIVYWSNTDGQRDIYTVAADGGTRLAVTEDAAIDWSPVWSTDGRFIYFASDRGGAMILWRIAIDESSGRPGGTPEAVTAGVQASAELPRFSKDGTRLAFRSRVASVNPVAIPFDPVSLAAGSPTILDSRHHARVPSDISADGRQIAYFSIGETQEDIFVGPPDGSMRRVTDDPFRDRAPVFTPDGRSIVFYSNRDGHWAAWMVAVDGGGLRKLTSDGSSAIYPQVSPTGDALAFTGRFGRAMFSMPLGSTPSPTASELPGTAVGDELFSATAWSPDGARLAGILQPESGRPSGVGVYALAEARTVKVADDETYAVKWLADSRRVVYFTQGGSGLVVVDTVTGERTAVEVRLPAPSMNEVFAVSPDNRTIYYGAARAEADIWIVERR
jgi:Tol biopolymer transport system component/serine/threonine protein kinase